MLCGDGAVTLLSNRLAVTGMPWSDLATSCGCFSTEHQGCHSPAGHLGQRSTSYSRERLEKGEMGLSWDQAAEGGERHFCLVKQP